MQVVLWGGTGQAIVLAELFGRLDVPIAALFDNESSRESPVPGVPMFHGREGFARWLAGVDPAAYHGLAAIGGAHGADRLEIHEFFANHGLAIATAVHPAAFVAADARLGRGVQVMANAAVGSRTVLDEAVLVNTSASVDHECVLGAGAHIGPGAVLAGCVRVGELAFVGAGATLLPRITIGRASIVGAGAVVTRDVPDGVVAYGNPARVMRRS